MQQHQWQQTPKFHPMDVESLHSNEEQQTSPGEIETTTASSATTRPNPLPKWLSFLRYWILATIALFSTLLCPGRDHHHSIWSITIAYALTIILFLRVQQMDPGFISQHIMQDYFQDEFDYLGQPKGDTPTPTAESDIAIEEESNQHDPLVHNGVPIITSATTRRKICETCNLAPPLRSHHCSSCHRCVGTFDHHCQLVGNCIGERNRCIFWWFLLVQVVAFGMCNNLIGTSRLGLSTLLFSNKSLPPETKLQALVVVGTKIYLYSLTFAAYIMLAMHSFFAVTNLTTFEVRFGTGGNRIDYLRNIPSVMDLPFSQGGCAGNLARLCCPCDNSRKSIFAPTVWRLPEEIITDSEKWWEYPWQNKYWSCC